MKKLKIILPYKYFILLFITFFYVYIITNNLIYKTNYKEGYNEIKGVITSIEIGKEKTVFTLKSKENIKVTYYGKLDLEIGDVVIAKGNLELPSGNTVFNLFNYKLYLMSNKIYYILKLDSVEKIGDNFLYKIKNNIYKKVENLKSSNYIKTFVLGDKSDLDNNIKLIYQENGISHLLAISGMHISLLAGILKFLLNRFKFHHILISIFLIFYAFLTNFTPSIIRATLFFIFSKKIDIKKLIIIVFCLMLLYNPYYIYNVGFLFSFVVSFYLIMFNKLINKYNNYFIKVFIISLISFLAGLPIMINNFYSINLMSVFLNIIFVPLVSFVIFPLSLITLFIPVLDNLLFTLINIFEYLSIFLNKFNINLTMCVIPFYMFVFYYIVITLILLKPRYFYVLIIVILIHTNIKKFSFNSYLTILDVGQGDSALLEIKDKTILIDTGGVYSDYSIILNKTIPYLKSRGIRKVDYLILTHGDYDHMGEAINLVDNFKVEKVFFNCGEFNELEQELIKVLDKKKIPYYSCIKKLNIDDNKLYFLNNWDYGNENDNSSVIYIELNSHKFLFMGDAGIEVEEALIEKYNLKDIEILKVGHHGSRTSSSQKFIEEIKPKYSIISVGKNNRYGHPNKEVLDNIEDSKIYRTDKDGSIMFKIKNDRIQIETCES